MALPVPLVLQSAPGAHLSLSCGGQVFSCRRVRPDWLSRLLGSGPGGGLPGGGTAGDAAGQVGGVFVDESEQGRAAAVLPGQAEEVQAGDIGDAAAVDQVPVTGYAGDAYPGVVRAVTGGPHHDADVQAAAVGEPDGAPFRAGHRGPEPDPGRPEPAAAAADDDIGPPPQPASQPGPGGDAHQAEPGEPPEQVLARQPLR